LSRVCLDSWAVLRWLEGAEPAATAVDEVMPDHPIMSWINVGEVYYVTRRLAGANEADDIVRRMRAVVDLDLPSADRIMAAARIKAQHPLAYADAFAVATTLAYDAVLYTGDPEILEATAGWPVRDLRSSG
jgi:predicted nucleic acid-binding protein